MFRTLFLKEIQETINTQRLFISMLICLVLIPTGAFVSLKDYNQRYDSYQNAERLYHERSEGKINNDFRGEGYRPPSELSIFSTGLEYFFPNKITTNRDGRFTVENKTGLDTLQSHLFGKIDFLFIVTFVLSLLALIFTFGSVTSEKESGTLRLVISNSVPRWKIIMAKILGSYSVFFGPFLISLTVMILIIVGTGSFDIFSPEILPKVLSIFSITVLFLLSMFSLGVLVSTLTSKSMTSMVALLFVWVVFAFLIPKLSPMLAESIYPVKSSQAIDMEKRILRETIFTESKQKQIELLERIRAEFGINEEMEIFGFNKSQHKNIDKAQERYEEQKTSLVNEYNNRLTTELNKIDQNYKNEMSVQAKFARTLSRTSPISCFGFIITEISDTGFLELYNIDKNARIFQQQIDGQVYDNYNRKEYFSSYGSYISNAKKNEGYNEKTASVPHLDKYLRPSLTDIFKAEWIDILLLMLYNILFFTGAFVSFLKYDVR